MGYVLKDIATIGEPARVSLAGLPNFLTISSKTTAGTAYRARIAPTGAPVSLTITDSAGGTRGISSTDELEDAGGYVFYYAADPLELAENIKAAVLNDAYISANFNMYSDVSWNNGAPTVNGVIIEAKENGPEFNLTLSASGATTTSLATGTSSDSIKGNNPMTSIFVDVYRTETGAYIREIAPSGRLGDPVITLNKTYAGAPVWFDLNAVPAQSLAFTPPPASGWFPTRTLESFRVLVRVGEGTHAPFYISEVLHAISGHGRLTDPREMLAYAFISTPVKTLTNKPETEYRRGQTEYLTWLKGAALTGLNVSVVLKAFNGAGMYLGRQVLHSTPAGSLAALSSCAFKFDALLDLYPGAVTLSVVVALGGAEVTAPQVYRVAPECLHKLHAFSFINRLGGWDSFNLDGISSEENRPESETFSRTVTPAYSAAEGVEAVHRADLDTAITITGARVAPEVAAWLKELAAAKVVLDGQGRRVIIEALRMPISEGEYVAPVLTYRLSETYTNGY